VVGKREGCQKIFGIITFVAVCGIFFASNAQENTLQSVSRYDQEIRSNNRQLDAIKTEIEKGRQKLNKLQQDEGNSLAQLEQIEKNIAASQQYLAVLSQKIDTVEKIITALADSLKQSEHNLVQRQKIMRHRLRQAYMNGTPNLLVTLYTSRSPLEAVNKVTYMEKVSSYDRELTAQIASVKQRITQRKAAHTLELAHLSALRATKASEKKAHEAQELQRKSMLAGIRKEKSSFESMVKELERSQKELVTMIKLLEKKRKKAKDAATTKKVVSFEKKKGSLPWPVEGAVVTKFGKVVHPEYQTVIMNNGIDIEAAKGDTVRCTAPGTVIHTGWLRGLGKMVIVDHVGGYLTIYAHLESIDVAVDQQVATDSVLGRVGDTGSLAGSRMHFEVRKSSEALNPIDWLEKR